MTNLLTSFPIFEKKIRYDIPRELSTSRGFSLIVISYLLFLKKQQKFEIVVCLVALYGLQFNDLCFLFCLV